MARDPYRRPDLPPPEKPRGTVVRRAALPGEVDPDEHERTRERYRAQSARVHAELEAARREGAVRSRATGGALLAIGLFLCWVSVDSSGGYRHSRTLLMAGGSIFAGAWLLAVGAGGAISLRDAPPWVKAGAAVAFAIGGIFGITNLLGLVAIFAR